MSNRRAGATRKGEWPVRLTVQHETGHGVKMKNCTLFAIIGWILFLLTQIWWLTFSIVGSIVGYEKLHDIQPIANYISSAFCLIASISMIAFLAMLFSRQK